MFRIKDDNVEIKGEVRVRILCSKCNKEHFADEDCSNKENIDIQKDDKKLEH